eukprot:8913602-Prorocentrum_lima.AAC.1
MPRGWSRCLSARDRGCRRGAPTRRRSSPWPWGGIGAAAGAVAPSRVGGAVAGARGAAERVAHHLC